MHNVQFEILRPTDDSAFEDMCARIYGVVFGDPTPQTNGRNGQKQGGIDVFIDAPEGRIGIQCKRYADAALKRKHVEHEIAEVDNAKTAIVRFIVATTATSDAVLLGEVQKISDTRMANGLFPVQIEFWQDLCRHIRGSSKLQNDYAPNAPGAIFHRIDERDAEFRTSLRSINSRLEVLVGLPVSRDDSVNKYFSSQLDLVNELLRAARFKDALDYLQRIGLDLTLLDVHQQARWHVQRGICTWHLDNGAAAAADFIHAAELCPDDDKIAAAQVRGLLFQNEVDQALDAGKKALARFPASTHVWIAQANAKMVKGFPLDMGDVPFAMREDGDVLQLIAWARKQAGDLAGAVALSAKALTRPNAAFFVRSTALALALEAAASDPVQVAHGLVGNEAVAALKAAMEALSPWNEHVWNVQSPGSVDDTLVHLGYGYLVLDKPEMTFALAEEARLAGLLSPRLKRMALEAYRHQNRLNDLLKLGREWLNDLEEEALMLVAETAAVKADVTLIEAVRTLAEQKDFYHEEVPDLLRALRWLAMWRSDTAKQEVLAEIRDADIANSGSLVLICSGARILHEDQDEAATEAAIAKALVLVSADSRSAKRLLLADLLFTTDRLAPAAHHYKLLSPQGKHSELHNRLLGCYIRTGALRKAKDLVLSFPDTWTNNERALNLAIELGQRAADWDFLVPLAKLQCERHPLMAGSWLFRLALDFKMRKMMQFHQALESIPTELNGPPRLLAQVASFEMRFDRKEAAMRRLYAMFRRNLDDPDAASAYLIAILGGSTNLPFMEDALTEVRPGSTVTLKNDFGDLVTLSVDLEDLPDLPARQGMVAPSSDIAGSLLQIAVGTSVTLPGPLGTTQRYVVEKVMSAYRHLLGFAQEQVKLPTTSSMMVMSVPLPSTEKGIDFSHVHAVLKQQSDHSRRAFEAYADGPVTLGILSKLLGRSVIDVVAGWPSHAPPLLVSAGTKEQREATSHLLRRLESDCVIDVATVIELALHDGLVALTALPRVYISTKAVELLEIKLEESRIDRSEGQIFDDNGDIRFVKSTVQNKHRQTAFIQSVLDGVKKHCVVVPAYGSEELTPDLEQAKEVLVDEEYAALLLAVEKDATLLTVDGALAQFGRAAAGIASAWPQEILRHAMEKGKLNYQQYTFAVVRMFLCNRNFISLSAYDLVFMCLQGGYPLKEGLQRFKTYLASSSVEFESGMTVALGFLEMQSQHPTQFKAFTELLSHLVEAGLRHPGCNKEEFLQTISDFVHHMAWNCSGSFIPYAPIQASRQARMEIYVDMLAEAVGVGTKFAALPVRQRAIKLQAIKCMRLPYLVFDGETAEFEQVDFQGLDVKLVPSQQEFGAKTTAGETPRY